jgi:hypothetical protein
MKNIHLQMYIQIYTYVYLQTCINTYIYMPAPFPLLCLVESTVPVHKCIYMYVNICVYTIYGNTYDISTYIHDYMNRYINKKCTSDYETTICKHEYIYLYT